MLTYKFSRREKFLIGTFLLLLMAVGWYQLVYVNTTDQIERLDAQIADVNNQITDAKTKLAKKREMERIIEQRKAEGAQARPIPQYDNIEPLMKVLSPIMNKADVYTLSFDGVDTESGEYILRGVTMKFNTDSYETVKDIIGNVVDSEYPCIVNSVNIVGTLNIFEDTTIIGYSSSIHAVYFEKPTAEMIAQREARAAAEAAVAAAEGE